MGRIKSSQDMVRDKEFSGHGWGSILIYNSAQIKRPYNSQDMGRIKSSQNMVRDKEFTEHG